jgi:hypothetical protein
MNFMVLLLAVVQAPGFQSRIGQTIERYAARLALPCDMRSAKLMARVMGSAAGIVTTDNVIRFSPTAAVRIVDMIWSSKLD